MADLNRLTITTVHPDARPSMQGSQGQKPRKQKKKSEREQAELTPAQRFQAAQDKKLRDMLHRQEAGKQHLQPRQAGEQAPNLDAEILEAVGSIKAGSSSSGDAAFNETALSKSCQLSACSEGSRPKANTDLERPGDSLSLEGAVRAEVSSSVRV